MVDTTKMMTDAYNIQKAIEGETIQIEENGIKIIMGGDLKIKDIQVNDKREDTLKGAINSAIRKTQEMQVLKMKTMVDVSELD